MISWTSWGSHFPGRWPPSYVGITGASSPCHSDQSPGCDAAEAPSQRLYIKHQQRLKWKLKIFASSCRSADGVFVFPADIDHFSESLPLQVLESATKKQKVDGPDVRGPKFLQRLKIGGDTQNGEIGKKKYEPLNLKGFPMFPFNFQTNPCAAKFGKKAEGGAEKKCFWWVADAQRQVLECFGMVLSNVKQSRAIPTFFFKHKHHKPDLKHSLSIDKGEGTATDGQKHPNAILNM